MSPLIETIKVYNNILQDLSYHNNRLNTARWELYGLDNKINIKDFVIIPELNSQKIYKCRVLYDKEFISFEFHEYIPKIVHNLKLVNCDELNYQYKFADRHVLDGIKDLYPEFDSIIFVKQGLITDCNFANLVFFDGKKWYTPKSVLLKGTKRQRYLDEGLIFESEIRVDDIKNFTSVRLINAMIDLDTSPDIAVQNIY